MPSAAAIIIGDEILSGKTQDTNTHALAVMLRASGVELCRVVTIPDDPALIAQEVELCSSRFDHVITSGGVGPTHDDRTIEGVARAFGRPVVMHPELERLVRGHWGERINDAALKLAEIPEGARLLYSDDGLLPVVALENVYVLPGIPQLFEAKLSRIRQELSGARWVLHSVYLSGDESSVAGHLSQVEQELPGVKIGSYPRLDVPDHRLRITVESAQRDLADRGLERVLELVPAHRVIRVERDGE
jgi:molybdenum cofactor synthesis domain-containing protein